MVFEVLFLLLLLIQIVCKVLFFIIGLARNKDTRFILFINAQESTGSVIAPQTSVFFT